MKRYIWPVLFLTFFMLASSCTEGRADFCIVAEKPDEGIRFSYYDCTISREGFTLSSGSRDGIFHFTDLIPGQTDIRINAFDENGGTEYEGMSSFVLKSGDNITEVMLAEKRSSSKTMTLHFPATGRTYATLMLEGNDRIIFQDREIVNGKLELEKLEYGRYRIRLTWLDSTSTRNRDYRFTCSSDTPDELILMGTDGETDGNVSLEFFDLTSSPIDGRIRVTEGQDEMTLAIQIGSISQHVLEKELEFLWFQNGMYAGSGRSIVIDKRDGVFRYDCIVKSRLLGSWGSESISISISR